MSSYPWGGMENSNPYTSQNQHSSVGVQPVDSSGRIAQDDADVTVSSASGMVDAVEAGGQTVWLETGRYNVDSLSRRIDPASGTTLASDGATLVQTEAKSGVFNPTNDNVRITGIRFEGPHIGYVEDFNTSRAILIRGNIELDNCEFYGWASSGVYVGEGGGTTEPSEILEPNIHHNVIRDNQGDGLGYGIVVYNGNPQIEWNFINANRHGIAAGGSDWCSYIAENNVHGEDGLMFQFEQHAPGGVRMEIRNNEFRMVTTDNGEPARAYAQRGTPNDVAIIERNHIFNPSEPGSQPDTSSDAAIVQYEHNSSDWVNVEFSNNAYGEGAELDSDVGIQSSSGSDGSGDSEDSSGFDGFNGTTDSSGSVEAQVPDGEYEITFDHGDYEETLTGTVNVTEDMNISASYQTGEVTSEPASGDGGNTEDSTESGTGDGVQVE